MDQSFRHGAALPNDDFQWGPSVEKDRTSLKYKNETWRFCIHDFWWCSYFKKWWFSTATLDNQEAPNNLVSTETKIQRFFFWSSSTAPRTQRCLTPATAAKSPLRWCRCHWEMSQGSRPREGMEQRPYDSTADDCKNLGAQKKPQPSPRRFFCGKTWEDTQNPMVHPNSNGESSILILLPRFTDAWNGHNQIPMFTASGNSLMLSEP